MSAVCGDDSFAKEGLVATGKHSSPNDAFHLAGDR